MILTYVLLTSVSIILFHTVSGEENEESKIEKAVRNSMSREKILKTVNRSKSRKDVDI